MRCRTELVGAGAYNYCMTTSPTPDSAAGSHIAATPPANIVAQRQAALLKTGALQNAIFNSANFSIIATDAKGVIQLFNTGAERVFGYIAAEVVDQITPAHLTDPLEVVARAVLLSRELGITIAPGFDALVFKAARGMEDIYELTCIRKDGSGFPALVSVTALRDDGGGLIGYLLTGTDNTAHKQMDDKLRHTEESFRLMVESVTDYAIAMLDPEGRVVSWNSGAQRISGYLAGVITGHHVSVFYSRQDVESGAPQADLALAVANGRIDDERWLVRADGSTFRANLALTGIRDKAGHLRGFAMLTRDLTARRQVEAELANTKLMTQKNNEANLNFLSDMSHEMRSSLNAILGFAQLMESEVPLPTPPQMESIAKILQAGWYQMELINEFLDLATIESGRLSWSLDPVPLAEVMRDCQASIETQAQKSGIRIQFPEVRGDCFIKADRTRLKQVLINLLSNAIKYNQQGGSVIVACHASALHRIRISVTDTGIGLSPESLAQLFRPFGRVGQDTSATDSGTGIGLVVTKRLVELMGGEIGVTSSAGDGSTFWFELTASGSIQNVPAGTAVATPTTPGALAAPPAQHGTAPRTLLYVEDNPANLQLVSEIIARRTDLRLLSARTGQLGIDLAHASKPEVIVMDINLPGMSGIEALQILRSDAATAQIPVVALSASAMPRDIERGLEAGFFRYLTKPIKVKEFLAVLDLALESAGARDAALSAALDAALAAPPPVSEAQHA